MYVFVNMRLSLHSTQNSVYMAFFIIFITITCTSDINFENI